MQSAGSDMGEVVCRRSVLGGSEYIQESIILDCVPLPRNLDIHVQNVHSYPLEPVVDYYVGMMYENCPVSIF